MTHVHRTFAADQPLITTQVVNNNYLYTDQTQCLAGHMMFDDSVLRQRCPFPKTQEACMDGLRSQQIMRHLLQAPTQSSESLSQLSDIVPLCSTGMRQLVKDIQHAEASPDVKILAQTIHQACKF